MADAMDQIDQLVRTATEELDGAKNVAALEAWRIKYLGAKGKMKDLMGLMGGLPKEEKPVFGQRANGAKKTLTDAFEARQAASGPRSFTGRDRCHRARSIGADR